MFEISTIEVSNQKENTTLKKSINLDSNLDCFIMISSSSNSLAENLLNHTLESIIDKISKEDTYNDFGIALENINSFLKNWRIDQEEEHEIDMNISILNENNLMFSNIGKSTVYLINRNHEIIELTERNENKKSFLFISSGVLANSEIIISSTLNILKYLSKSDIIDGMVLSNDIEIFNKNIKNILQSEIVEKNCIISSLKYKNEVFVEENPKITAIKDMAVQILDTNISKTIIGKGLMIKEKISNQSKTTKNILFFSFIGLLIILLFFIVSGFFDMTTKVNEKEVTKSQLNEIREVITEASRNIANPGIFNTNIEKAETLISELEEKNLSLLELPEFKDEINILKKQFNKIEIFYSGNENQLYSEVSENNVKILRDSTRTYIIQKKGVIGPIIQDIKPKNYLYNSLGDDEEFVDGGILGQDIYLLTNTSKIIKFNRNGSFNVSTVSGQQSWEKMKTIATFNSSIYTLGENNQVYRHQGLASGFGKGNEYLKEADLNNLGEIIGMGIDGGIYLVKRDLSVVKFFSSPYRLESLSVNRYPKNYSLEDGQKFFIKARDNLNYVYMLINDKIFVFKPNSNRVTDTRSLTYIGQIEGGNEKILDFEVVKDGELNILNNKGIYKLNFEVSDDKLILR